MPLSILQTVVTRYTSKFMAHKLLKEVQHLLFYFIKVVSIFLVIVLAVIVAGDHPIASFLRIDEKRLVYAVALAIIFNSFSAISLGALSGLQLFNDVALNSVVATVSKLFSGFILVILGLRAFGGLLGFVFSFAIALLLSLFQLPKGLIVLKNGGESVALNKREVYLYFLPVGLSMLCFFALTNMDIILVKHYFVPLDAGYYSVAQIVGKIVLFIPGAIGVVMFPKIVVSHAKRENTKIILRKCLIAVGVLCGTATFAALLFPDLILSILTGHNQPQAVSLVKFFAVSMSFYALINIFMLYHLSLHRMRYIYLMVILTILQFLGICLFHKSLTDVLVVLTVCAAVLFCCGIFFSKGPIHARS
jgi:O-antigen/teichoic acid export membrane protein